MIPLPPDTQPSSGPPPTAPAPPPKTFGTPQPWTLAAVGAGVVIIAVVVAIVWFRPAPSAVMSPEQIAAMSAMTQRADELAKERDSLQRQLETSQGADEVLRSELKTRDEQLTALEGQIRAAGAVTPDSVSALEGDRHDRLAMDYLRSKGVGTSEAYRLVSQVALTEVLLPGFKVWFLYRNGQFGTWVSQGAAATSPQSHAEYLAMLLTQEKDALAQALNDEKTGHEQTRADRDDLRNLAAAADAALQTNQAELRAMTSAADGVMARASTARYLVGSKDALVRAKVIDGSFRLLPTDQGSPITLSGPLTLPPIDPGALGLRRIRKVTLVPGTVVPGRDYDVQLLDGFAQVTIRQADRFLEYARFFVVVVE